MTDRIITQQSHLSAVLAERTADLEIVRQALAERMQLNRLREEIAIARDLQLTYLPDVSEAQSLLPGIDLHALMRPAKEVGGDVYDFRRLDEQRLMLIIGDASGKGIPAAMYILMCRILLQTAVGILGSTAQALRVANDALSRDNDAMVFTTAFVAILNLPTGELTYTNAGHNKPLIRRANGQVEALSGAHGVLMGVAEGFDYQEAKAFISPGDTLLLYTDGVTEAHAPDDNLFGENRLISSLTEAAAGNAAETVQALIEAVDAFSAGREQSDDITLTVLRRPLAT
jgi:sigma-B regulation protein RsbU (phosphoserine phosphatase)